MKKIHELTKNPAVYLFVLALLVYAASYRGEGKNWNYFVWLADAFLHGRLYMTQSFSWLNELIPRNGHYFIAYPPVPAILLTPFVFLFGTGFPQPYVSIFIGAVNVGIATLVAQKLFSSKKVAVWLGLLYGFGTIHWYHAEVGSVWYFAQIVGLLFVWLTIWESITKKRFWLIGVWISLGFLSRLPDAFAVFFPLIFCYADFWIKRTHGNRNFFIPNFKAFLLLGMPLLAGLIVYGWYNFARFGSITDSGYGLIPGVLQEPWFRYGIENIRYVPEHIKDLFWSFPRFRNTSPYVIPNVYAMAIWVTTPAFFLLLRLRRINRLVLACLAATAAIGFVGLMHGSTGFTQFGFRFALDYLPFLVLLVGVALQGEVRWYAKLLIVLSILINLWGVVLLSFLNIWSF